MIPKFRAWDKENKRWMTPEIEDSEESELRLDIWGNLHFKSPWFEQESGAVTIVAGESIFDLSQHTGLKDKNGVEIYEGDVVELNVPTYKTTTKTIGDLYDAFILDKNVESISHIEVIGNVYENPDLVEESEE